MRNILLTASAIAMLGLTACQKEVDEDNPGGGGGTTTQGTRLVKMVTKEGNDSTQMTFSYNGAGKVTGYVASGISAGQPVDLRVNFSRNSAGIIQTQVTKSNELLAFGIDSIETFISYDAANSRYKHAITEINLFGFAFTDSVVFNYDGAGKLVSQIDYFDDGSGLGYEPLTKIEYTYTGLNLLTQKIYSYDPNTTSYVLEETYTFEYDAKTNPLLFASEAVVLGMTQFYSANNVTKTTMVSVTTPSDNFISNVTYTYNTANRPSTATETDGTTTSVTTYTYQ